MPGYLGPDAVEMLERFLGGVSEERRRDEGEYGASTRTRRSSGKLNPRMKTWTVSIELLWRVNRKHTYHVYVQWWFSDGWPNSTSRFKP